VRPLEHNAKPPSTPTTGRFATLSAKGIRIKGARTPAHGRLTPVLMTTALVAVALLAIGSAPAAAAECPNEALRTGLSADLPDCRAYELVTPSDADGRTFQFDLSLGAGASNHTATELGSPNGNSYVYTLAGEPLSEIGEPNGTQDVYETVRTAEGWRTIRRLTPSGAQAEQPISGGVSPDHQYSFVEVGGDEDEGSLSAEGGESSNYLQRPDGTFELIGVGSLGEEREATGDWLTSQGTHIIFSSGDQAKQLEPTAPEPIQPEPKEPNEPPPPPIGIEAIYDRSANGPTHVVSLLPGNVTPTEGADYQGASADGSVIAFKIGEPPVEDGVMYVRIDNASTEEVTGGAATVAERATFAGISAQGGSAFYVRGGNIFDFDVASGQTRQVNSSGDAEVTHISEDGSHVYFISPSLLDGAEGTPGEPNLYVWDAATNTTAFIATVAPGDANEEFSLTSLNGWTARVVAPEAGTTEGEGPGADASRTSADGSVIAFLSSAKLTAYENAGHTEVYRYDTRSRSLLCVSCNPSGEPATGNARFEATALQSGINAISAHAIVHNVSDDGLKVFFETEESLVPQDRDESNDIYEWSAGSEGGEPSLALISSGQTPIYRGEFTNPIAANELAAVTPNGDDVFFFTTDALTPASGLTGTPAIYDARAGGGFAESALTKSCAGDECQRTLGVPQISAPATEILEGAGNLAPLASKPPAKAKAKPLTRAQKLAGVLKRCKKDKVKKQRAACEKNAHRRYGRGK
jgi:Tol biopolymer transport system component